MRVALLVSTDLVWAVDLAIAWREQGDEVTIVLLDAAAAAARQGHTEGAAVSEAVERGLAVLAHDDALRRRAIWADRTLAGVKPVDLDEIADLVTEGAEKVMWL